MGRIFRIKLSSRCRFNANTSILLNNLGPSQVFFRLIATATILAAPLSPLPAKSQPSAIDERILQDIQVKGSSRVIVQTGGAHSATMLSAAKYLSSSGAASASVPTVAVSPSLAVVNANSTVLEKLKSDGNVVAIIRDDPLPPLMDRVASTIGADKPWTAGLTGKGVAIAIVDTGIDKTHPVLAGKIVSEACFSVTDPTSHSKSLCPAGADIGNGDWVDTSTGSGVNCDTTISGCKHGTHVAGLAAGQDVKTNSGEIVGIAPGAEVVSIQVYSSFDRHEDCQDLPAPCALSFISSQLRALRYIHSLVLDHMATGRGPHLVAANLSLGGGDYGVPCDAKYQVYANEVRDLRQAGVAVFVAAGNDGYTDGVGFPGCLSGAVTIGALDDPGSTSGKWSIASFSDRSGDKLVSLLTFGVNLRSSVPSGGYEVMSGTSMATPVAAGAYAILAAGFPNATTDEIIQDLHDTGRAVTEPVSSKTLIALDLSGAYFKFASADAAKGSGGAAGAKNKDAATAETNRFVVEVPTSQGADVSQKGEHVRQSLREIQTKMRTLFGFSDIGPDSMVVTSERAIAPDVLKHALAEAGAETEVHPDQALRSQTER